MAASDYLSLTRLLDRTGLLTYDPEQETYTEMTARAPMVMTTNEELPSPKWPWQIGQRLASTLGIIPRTGERLDEYWRRNFSRSMPPGLLVPQGKDIQLPKERIARSLQTLKAKTGQ